MPGTELRSTAHSRIGPQRGRLHDAAVVFEQISSNLDADAGPWLNAVQGALDGLAAAWAEHVAFTEGPDGLFEELLGDTLDVAAEVDRLRRDHEVVQAQIARTRELLAQPAAGPDDNRVLMALAGISRQVDQHRRRGADLLYRVYSVDVSAGD
jgi:hypothetical protein